MTPPLMAFWFRYVVQIRFEIASSSSQGHTQQDQAFHAMQLPLPQHLDEEAILEAFDPSKDVDGFHPLNMGLAAVSWLDKHCSQRGN